jgi:hypothetical protein
MRERIGEADRRQVAHGRQHGKRIYVNTDQFRMGEVATDGHQEPAERTPGSTMCSGSHRLVRRNRADELTVTSTVAVGK